MLMGPPTALGGSLSSPPPPPSITTPPTISRPSARIPRPAPRITVIEAPLFFFFGRSSSSSSSSSSSRRRAAGFPLATATALSRPPSWRLGLSALTAAARLLDFLGRRRRVVLVLFVVFLARLLHDEAVFALGTVDFATDQCGVADRHIRLATRALLLETGCRRHRWGLRRAGSRSEELGDSGKSEWTAVYHKQKAVREAKSKP